MQSKFLIIDDDAKFRHKLKQVLAVGWPNIAADEYDPANVGWPLAGRVNWTHYALVFCDPFSKSGDGLHWLVTERKKTLLPPVIVAANNADVDVVVKAIKSGAENFLVKPALNAEKLVEMIGAILGTGATSMPRVTQTLSLLEDDIVIPRPSVTPLQRQPEVSPVRVPPVVLPLIPAKAYTAAKPQIRQDTVNWPAISGYRILEKIGQGGMSVIYLADRLTDHEKVVIKTLSVNMAENKKTLLRSNQEFKLISRITNRNIVRLYEHGTIGDAMYTVMEYFLCGDLKRRLKQGINQQQALKYMMEIASGLAAIHGSGVIHRDLKPGNIMFREDDSLAIIDFGISKDINTRLDLTDPGQVMGTPNYMAPEQGNGGYRADARSDIYSVGVMLYEMLTGKKPYAASTGAAIIYKHLHDPIPKLPNQFFEMQGLLNKMMAKYPQDRFQSALDLIEYIRKEFRWDLTLNFV